MYFIYIVIALVHSVWQINKNRKFYTKGEIIDSDDSSATQFIFYTLRLGYLPYLYQADWSLLKIAGFVFLVEIVRFFFVAGTTMLITALWLNDQEDRDSE